MKEEIWTKSIREEIIGVLWLILAVLLIMIHADWIFCNITLFLGIISEIGAIFYAITEAITENVSQEGK